MAYNPLPTVGRKAQTASLPVVLSDDLNTSGSFTAAAQVSTTLDCAGVSTIGIQLTGTFVATMQVQVSLDNTNFITITGGNNLVNINTVAQSTANSDMTAVGMYMCNVAGARYVRLRCAARTSGTAVFNIITSSSYSHHSIRGTVPITGFPAAITSADASGNTTTVYTGSYLSLFNGSTWDRARGMSIALTTGDTGAKVATGNGTSQNNVGNTGVQILIDLGAVTGTTPTCEFKLQGSVNGGTNWYDIPGAATATLTASGLYGITVYPGVTSLAGTTTSGTTASCPQVLPRTWRVVWTIGGTTPSFTITSITYNYLVN